MKLSVTLVLMVSVGMAALCGRSATLVGEEEAAVLKIEQRPGAVAEWKMKSEETVKAVEKVVIKTAESTAESSMEYSSESLVGMVVGNKTESGREATLAETVTARSLKIYMVNGVDKRAEEAVRHEAPRLPSVRAVQIDEFGREIISGETVPGCEAWENYVIGSARALPVEGLKSGETVTNDIMLGGGKIGTVEFKAEFKKSEDGASPDYWVVSAKISAECEGEKITIDDYTARYAAGQDTPGHVDYTVKIARNRKAGNSEMTTEITRKVSCEQTGAGVLEKEALDKAASLHALTTAALDAMSKCDLTQAKFGATKEEAKVAATEAFWAAVMAAPRPSVVNDALYQWFLNAAMFMMPAIGKIGKPALGEKWINSAGIDWRDLAGKVVVVEFWATWCGPCEKASPHLDHIYKTYKDKGLEIIGMTVHKQGSMDEQDFVNNLKLTYPIALDRPSYLFDQKGEPWRSRDGKAITTHYTHLSYLDSYPGIPHAFVIDRKGNLNWKGHPADADFEKAIENVLKGE